MLRILSLLALALAAHANAIFQLNRDGCTGGCGAGPFAWVTLMQVSPTTVSVTEQLLSADVFAGTGAGKALEFQVDGPVTFPGWPRGSRPGARLRHPPSASSPTRSRARRAAAGNRPILRDRSRFWFPPRMVLR